MQQLNAYAFHMIGKEEHRTVETELIFQLETEAMPAKLQKKVQDWKNIYNMVGYELIDNGTVTKYQYKRSPSDPEDLKWWRENKKRSWQQVEDFDTSYNTVNFALTGRSY